MKIHINSSGRAVLVACAVASLMTAQPSNASILSEVAGNVAKTVHKAVYDTGKATEKAGRDIGKASEKAYKDTTKEVGRHPVEYGIGAAIVVGPLTGVPINQPPAPFPGPFSF